MEEKRHKGTSRSREGEGVLFPSGARAQVPREEIHQLVGRSSWKERERRRKRWKESYHTEKGGYSVGARDKS